jgi:hypothetical protein
MFIMPMLQITTHTSDIEGAGTSAHVNMVLSGTAGSSGSLDLSRPSSITHSAQAAALAAGSSHSANGFGRGDVAEFVVRCAPLGDLQQLVVWHDSSRPQPAWHLAYVEVAELSSGKVCASTGNHWLLLLSASSSGFRQAAAAGMQYMLHTCLSH